MVFLDNDLFTVRVSPRFPPYGSPFNWGSVTFMAILGKLPRRVSAKRRLFSPIHSTVSKFNSEKSPEELR